MSSNWLDHVFTCPNAYVYQAAFICDGCAATIFQSRKLPSDKDKDDSDRYPQGPYPDGGSEADSPQHCDSGESCVNSIKIPGGAKIGCPLGNPLTSDGERYVLTNVAAAILSKSNHKRAMGRLWHHLYEEVRPTELIKLDARGAPSTLGSQTLGSQTLGSQTLGSLLDQIAPKHARVPHELYTDLDHLYGAVMGDDEVALWRADITPEGNFTSLETVLLPAREFPGRTIEDAIKEAVDEGAWD